ncbi:hypothetical protein EV424DRAFT_1340618 [Suillus variegatus]|nr:hypothetical protein EV424DRAFT_1355504 [Suillus variegatus]KAG1795848.1 hypothetical protein EV424DRAFT_1353374 [Suillus variegatus]KAG1835520.1 hypothetical protein EV424DRAFT_1340618 [Suillus variegatus]
MDSPTRLGETTFPLPFSGDIDQDPQVVSLGRLTWAFFRWIRKTDSCIPCPPKFIQNEIKRLQSMPPWIRISIPSRDLPVDTLLNLPINLAFDDVDNRQGF